MPVPPADLTALAMFAGCSHDDVASLAELLEPVHAAAGTVLMTQGERSDTFLLLAAGTAAVVHSAPDGSCVEATLLPGVVVGEIALLRDAARTATVTARDDVTGYVGHHDAFDRLLHIPGLADQLVRTARQRLAAFVVPVPVQTRDGTQLLIRPVLPGDGARVLHGHVRFSPETVYRRFLSVRKPTAAMLNYLSQVDYDDHFVWVVLDASGGPDGPVVADARYVREEVRPTVAEVAFTVADDYQHRGIGSLLMAALAVAAHVGGVERFTASMLADNVAMRRIFDRAGATYQRDHGVVFTEFDVPPLDGLPLDDATVAGLRDVARQVISAVS
ncbi:GNAT family N-acetyltransferase [Mycobacterium sp. MYCO198283]|uniref:GNAT family N-acetyltransferase n=1 Tax=Mycobacterium sp. MYCO198283 TaxID=2883505 RepID=UPI001E2B26B3|nr:GNAT family N-acetyltransferase [Mycobacterium sp. MYCO198283]MCG5430962.1 GNAT family N-acetyltransferase [Mycobacterium sp. MYCO198283]